MTLQIIAIEDITAPHDPFVSEDERKHERKFGPAFAKPCFHQDTIICMDPRCQKLNQCRLVMQ